MKTETVIKPELGDSEVAAVMASPHSHSGSRNPEASMPDIHVSRNPSGYMALDPEPIGAGDDIEVRRSAESVCSRPTPAPSKVSVVVFPHEPALKPRTPSLRAWLALNAPAVYQELLARERAGVKREEYL